VASKLSRADAGERVSALADALSDALLMDELNAKEAMEALFEGGMIGAVELAGKPDKLVAVARRMVEDTKAPYAHLASASVRRALESIGEELDLCEQTLAKRYAGITDEAVVAARPFADELVLFSADAYLTASLTVLPWFQERLISETKTSTAKDEEHEVLLQRIFSPVPVSLVNHSGRGLWWKVLEHCNRICRESEIATVNGVRERTMALFNLMGAARDGSGS
jgi:hypothetical protein